MFNSKNLFAFTSFVALALYPLVSGSYGIDLVTKIMIFAVFALSLELLVGTTGLVCFGHAAFFGIGAYAAVLLASPTDASSLAWLLPASVLAASGVLDFRMGGPGYEIFVPNTNYVKVYAPKQTFGPAEWRRMVYQEKPRARQDGTFGEFDCPDASQTMARRNVSTTALQALNLLNGPFMIQQAELFAQRLQREASGADQQIRLAFWLALGREPEADELQAAHTLVQEQGLQIGRAHV